MRFINDRIKTGMPAEFLQNLLRIALENFELMFGLKLIIFKFCCTCPKALVLVVNSVSKFSSMAKLEKGILLRGTVGNLTFYVMQKHRPKRTYVRPKSSLTRKRVLNDKEFEKTRKHARDLGLASQIASVVYRALPVDISGRWIFRAIAGEAASLLYEGRTQEEVKQYLWNKYVHETQSAGKEPVREGQYNHDLANKENRKQLRDIFKERWQEQYKSLSFKLVWKRKGLFKPEDIPKRLGFMSVG